MDNGSQGKWKKRSKWGFREAEVTNQMLKFSSLFIHLLIKHVFVKHSLYIIKHFVKHW